MDINKIKESQIKNYKFTLNKVDSFLKLNPQFKNLWYSFLWVTYDSFSKRFKYRKKKKNFLSINLKLKNPPQKFFLTFGNIPSGIVDHLTEKNIENVSVKLTDKPCGFFNGKNFIYSRVGRMPFYLDAKRITFKDEIEKIYREIIFDNYPDLVRFEFLIEKLFSKNLPSFILVDEDRTKFKRVLIEYFRKKRVKSFVFQHGITPFDETIPLPMMKESFTPLNADFFICWGEHSYSYLKNFIPEDRLIIGGNPNYEIEKNDGVNDIDILIIDQQFIGFEEEFEYVYKRVFDILKNLNVNYMVYLRNEHNYSFLKRIFSKKKLIKWEKGKIKKVIANSKIITGFYSTALLEAILLCKPVIMIDFLKRGDFLGLTRSGMVDIVTDESEFEMSYKVLKDKTFNMEEVKHRLKFFIKYFGKDSSNIIVDKIREKL
ncbi:MAG: hypothetical protein QME48_04995 [bacterium]|uniref:Uncharacterized protein n=2 Tax=Bacteria candidate phyla TaxID=1783234 RepID=A0A101I4R4_UNCT6|nr:MAG: hypothetical protein XD76_0714 [candidate division TA06 bacterium 32_111]KUK87900.1 MAG: hypothetical protein XE03_0419 [candidate division TA06 bacterium 34_109]MDI6700571.1 hypothetical protein [bacterium]HAF08053.1 hypothetical protein [candidate division WOR-3 bacterium]HCP16246.1 hypothetical protein [candidate division WOR-3 bacterium]